VNIVMQITFVAFIALPALSALIDYVRFAIRRRSK
jgi:hypothetical protein